MVHSADGVQASLQTQAAECVLTDTIRSSHDNNLLLAAPGAISHNLHPRREKADFKLQAILEQEENRLGGCGGGL